MPIKKTCNKADAARMGKMADAGMSLKEIHKKTRVDMTVVKRVLKGREVRKDAAEVVETEIVGGDAVEVDQEEATAAVAAAPAAPAVDNRSPQQKAADTRKANAAAKKAEDAGDPEFLE